MKSVENMLEKSAEKYRFHDKLMTYEAFSKKRWPKPYEYELSAGEEGLYFFAPKHRTDPTDPMFDQIRERLDEFNPDVVLVEGMPQVNTMPAAEFYEWIGSRTDEELIRRQGESQFTAKLAAERGAKVLSPEPDDAVAIQYLEAQGISKEAIFAQQLAGAIFQYDRVETDLALEAYLRPYRHSLRRIFGANAFDCSLDHFYRLHEKMFGVPAAEATVALYEHAVDPVPWEGLSYGPINRVAAAWGRFRDQYIVDFVQDLFSQYKRVMLVYGSAHGVIQEPALRALMEHRVRLTTANIVAKPLTDR